MKKKVLKNVAILTFALFGLGIIGNNVMYGTTEPIKEGPGEGGGGGIICGQYTGLCWKRMPLMFRPPNCHFTGYMRHSCDN